MTQTNIDWELAKLQYEILGESVDTIAEEHSTTLNMVEYAIRSGEWERMPLAEAANKWTQIEDLDNLTEKVVEQIQLRMTALTMIRQHRMAPKYLALETALLGRTMEVIKHMDVEAPAAATHLKSIADVFHNLKNANGLLTQAAEQANDPSTGRTTVLIQNKYESPSGDPAAAKVANQAKGQQTATITVSDADGGLLSAETGV